MPPPRSARPSTLPPPATTVLRVTTAAATVAVAMDEILIEIETDKVVLEVPAPAAGVMGELVVGDGGTVVLWSDLGKDSLTTARGTVLVQGGLSGGDGGRVETSAAQADVANFRVNALAAPGRAGLWLIDPYDYVIEAAQASTISSALNTASVTNLNQWV